MDGNRRFARKERKQTIHGHQKGFSKLAEVLAWCESLQIPGLKTYSLNSLFCQACQKLIL